MLKTSLLFAAALFTAQVFASAPKVTAGNAGYYRFHVGDFEVTTLNDGIFTLPVDKLLTHINPNELKAALDKNFVQNTVPTSVDAFLVNTGAKLVLIDAGNGSAAGEITGHLLESMQRAGYKPEQVDAVLITHMHGDHFGGLVDAKGKANFPNATVYIGKADIEYWTNKDNAKGKPEMMAKIIEAAGPALEPYKKAGKLTPIVGDMEITPGVRTQDAHGHTVGHTNYVIESGGQKLVLLGDTIHVAQVQFEHPNADMAFDTDIPIAEKYREKVFADAAKGGYMIGAAHLPFPSVGHLRAEKKGYTFIPIVFVR